MIYLIRRLIFITVLMATFILAACDTENTEDDGKGLTDVTFDLTNQPIVITVHVLDTQAEVRKTCEALMGDGFPEQGCAVATRSTKHGHSCEIYTTKIRSKTDNGRIATWGHELVHCVYGLWH